MDIFIFHRRAGNEQSFPCSHSEQKHKKKNDMKSLANCRFLLIVILIRMQLIGPWKLLCLFYQQNPKILFNFRWFWSIHCLHFAHSQTNKHYLVFYISLFVATHLKTYCFISTVLWRIFVVALCVLSGVPCYIVLTFIDSFLCHGIIDRINFTWRISNGFSLIIMMVAVRMVLWLDVLVSLIGKFNKNLVEWDAIENQIEHEGQTSTNKKSIYIFI